MCIRDSNREVKQIARWLISERLSNSVGFVYSSKLFLDTSLFLSDSTCIECRPTVVWKFKYEDCINFDLESRILQNK